MEKRIDVTSGKFDQTVYILGILRGEGLQGKPGCQFTEENLIFWRSELGELTHVG